MSRYRRARLKGGTYFFTLATHRRRPLFASDANISILGRAFRDVRRRHPFTIEAIVLLPDHLHCLMALPKGVSDYSTRLRLIKSEFTRAFLEAGGGDCPVSSASLSEGRRGIWQRRFWEHTIRDEEDFAQHADYIHFNPVRHGYAQCPHEWARSSFERNVRRGWYRMNWCCRCSGRASDPPAMRRVIAAAEYDLDL